MGNIIKFSDGIVVDTSGPLRKMHLFDGWYIIGEGILIPTRDEKTAEEELKQLRGEK